MASNKKNAAVGAIAAGLAVGGGYGVVRLQQWSATWDRAAERGSNYVDPSNAVAPGLVAWQNVGRISTGLATARSFALLQDGTAVVAGESKLRHLSATGAVLRDIALAGVPHAVAVIENAQGTLFVVGVGDHVEVFDAAGTARGVWPALGVDAIITCLTPGVSGDTVWAADAGRRVVVEMDLSGRVLREIGREDQARHAPGLVVPSPHLDVAIAADGMAWISNPGRHELEGFDASGVMVRRWGEYGTRIDQFSGCCNPTDFFLLPDGRFVTAEKGTPRVKVYDGDGNLQSVVSADFVTTTGGIDVAADRAGRIWILDPTTQELRLYAPKVGR